MSKNIGHIKTVAWLAGASPLHLKVVFEWPNSHSLTALFIAIWQLHSVPDVRDLDDELV